MSLCCFWCHSQENLFVNKSTGTIHCIGCKGFMSKILNRWNQPCKRVHRVEIIDGEYLVEGENMAKIQDLIAKCEDSELFTQNLNENAVSWNVEGENGKVTFLTDPQIILEMLKGEKSKIGIVVWFPHDVFER